MVAALQMGYLQSPATVFDAVFLTMITLFGVGTGLGLSIVYRIIADHNGEISVKSEPGKGTTFTLRLPIR